MRATPLDVRIFVLAVSALVIVPSPSAAERPARIDGTVYDCATKAPLSGAPVVLRQASNRAGRSAAAVQSDGRGRFVITNIDPGVYVIAAAGRTVDAHARRVLRLDAGDALDVPVGIGVRGGCETLRVPPAPQALDVYVIR